MGYFETDTDCINQREYVGIPRWHTAGYLGEGINVFCDDIDENHVGIVADYGFPFTTEVVK